jgi:hypothetical protein
VSAAAALDLDLLTVDDLMSMLKKPRSTINHLCATGGMPGARKLGRHWYVPRASFESFFALTRKEAADARVPTTGQGSEHLAGAGVREGEANDAPVRGYEARGGRVRGGAPRRARSGDVAGGAQGSNVQRILDRRVQRARPGGAR